MSTLTPEEYLGSDRRFVVAIATVERFLGATDEHCHAYIGFVGHPVFAEDGSVAAYRDVRFAVVSFRPDLQEKSN